MKMVSKKKVGVFCFEVKIEKLSRFKLCTESNWQNGAVVKGRAFLPHKAKENAICMANQKLKSLESKFGHLYYYRLTEPSQEVKLFN